MRALTAPSELRKRVYIIDEVHMLSTHAFNALLKLIEEPPDHVVFVLATTDTHKVPATIISRTQRFDFRRFTEALIEGKLARICEAERARAEPQALALIAHLADGGMRDAESLLDQVLAYAGDQLTLEAVREAVGLADDAAIAALLDGYIAGDPAAVLGQIEALADAGRDMAQIAAQAEGEARRRLLASVADPALSRRLALILRTLAEAAGVGAREGRARLVMELLGVELPAAPMPAAVSGATQPTDAQHAAALLETAAVESPPPMVATNGDRTAATIRSRWAEVIERATPVIKPLLGECRPVALDGARLTLAFPEGRDFMRSRITQRAPAIEQLLSSIFGGSFAVECVATNVELEPLSVEQALGDDDPEARALLEGVLKVTGGELVDAPEVR